MHIIKFSPKALLDLKEIKEYTSKEWNEGVARKTISSIVDTIKNLAQFPLLGKSIQQHIDLPSDYRYLIVDKHYIFYRVEKNKVLVIRILSHRQDYVQKLFN